MRCSIEPTVVPSKSRPAVIGPSDLELNQVSRLMTAMLLARAIPTRANQYTRVMKRLRSDRGPHSPMGHLGVADAHARLRTAFRAMRGSEALRIRSTPRSLHC